MSHLNLGYVKSKTRSPGQILENPCRQYYDTVVIVMIQSLLKSFRMFISINPIQDWKWVMSDQMVGHLVKS